MISKKVFSLLEYNKVLEYITKYAHTELGSEIILSIKPLGETKYILQSGKFVSEAKETFINNDKY